MKLYYFSLRYIGNIEEAEELVQSVFINLWKTLQSLIMEKLGNHFDNYESAENDRTI
jgi:DNA-directed RNA polymerase specialized sigma24 family protein